MARGSCLFPERKEGKKQGASSPLRVQGTDGQGRRDQEPAEPGLVSAWPPTPARAGPWASCLVVAWNLSRRESPSPSPSTSTTIMFLPLKEPRRISSLSGF